MKAQGPLLSVVVTSYNQLNTLKFTLFSLKDQAPDVPYEIIVVDCESQQETAQFLADQAAKEVIRVVETVGRLGRTAARNQGAMAAHGKYLVFLDAGLVVGPSWWESLVRTLDKDAQVAATAGRILVPDGRIDHAGQAILAWETAAEQKLAGRSLNAGRLAEALGNLKPMLVSSLAGEALAVRAAAFFAVGGFSEDIGSAHVSYKALGDAEPAGLDLCLKLTSRRWRCVFNPESIMTRLRVAERTDLVDNETADCGTRELNRVSAQQAGDQARITERWLDGARLDFRVTDQAVVPVDEGNIRTYTEPVVNFQPAGRQGLVHPDATDNDNGDGPMASVVVLTHNALHYTRRCVASLARHVDPRHELIFVDNGSTDGTIEFLQDLVPRRANCQLILNEANLGFAAGNNIGMVAATGDHIVLLNSDTVVTDSWLETLIDAAETHRRAGLLGAVTNNISGVQKVSEVTYDLETLDNLTEYAADQARTHRGCVERTLRLTGFCLLIKRELISRIGGLDESFGLGNFEDNDYCLRAHLAGYDALVVRDCFVHHFGSRSFATLDIDYMDQIQGQWDVFKKKWGIPQETAFNAPVDLANLLEARFDPTRHFCRLPGYEPDRTAVTAEG